MRPPATAAADRPALARAERLRASLLAGLGRAAVRLLGASLRLVEVRREVVEQVWAAGGPVIYAVWHGRMLMLPYFYGHQRTRYVLASRSRDGELLSRFVQGFGARVVRGSSSRGSAAALRALTRLLRAERAEVVVAPDGPRGPRYVAHAGPVLLAKLAGAPVVPLGFGASRRTVLRSWDEFVIPHPFSRAVMVFGDPLVVPPDAGREALEAYRRTLEATLTRLTLEADRVAGVAGVPAL
ncbi:MAG: lysophospholipid acyltransferase family protein [Candidatus Rokubacteria bacterium]|nr:lysophospholipid acyltransferase family protein [Candidatus Rokubacteria bacterium]